MQNPELTKDAKVLLDRLYNAYRARRDAGSDLPLTLFGNVYETFMPEVSVAAATEAKRSSRSLMPVSCATTMNPMILQPLLCSLGA